MENMIPISYGEFYDFPRMIQFQIDQDCYFLRSYFDEIKVDYAELYDVYLLSFQSGDAFKQNPYFWVELNEAVHLGQIPVKELGLDETRRKSIDGSHIKHWLSIHKGLAS